MIKKFSIMNLSFLLFCTPLYADNLKSDQAVKKDYSLGGQVTLKDSIDGGQSYISMSSTWKPDAKDYWFLKATPRYNFEGDNEGFSYSWGLGYDDWHTGTWTAQLNNYEVLKPGDGFNIEKATASLGYKLDSDFLKKRNLRSTITLSQIVKDGEPKLSTSLQWTPKKYWFAKAILIAPLEGGDLNYNYIFGYDDWHPQAFGFEYSNYQSNPLNETNFREGYFALTYKWKFK